MVVRWRRIIKKWIPGIISGGADNDPSGIATYSISGAQFGYNQLWLLILSTPMLISVQAMCGRLGDVKKKGLMMIIREHYAPAIAILASVVLIITNTATLGADIAGMADAFGLVTNTSFMWWVLPLSVILWYVIVFKNFKIIERYLFGLSFVFFAYIVSGILAKPDWGKVLVSIVHPTTSFTLEYFVAATGLLGTTITPFLFFWQARQGVEEHQKTQELTLEAKREDARVAPGFIYSNVISLFIMISTAAVIHAGGAKGIVTAADAARGLEPIAGPLSKYVFAFGIIGAGLMAIPVLATSTAYAVAETFGWRESLSDAVSRARGFYAVISATMVFGVLVAISGVPPMIALLYSQVLNGILGPILVVLIILMCNDQKIMGRFVNRWFDNVFGWITVVTMVLGSTGMFWQLVFRK